MKKILSLVLVVIMVITGISVFAEDVSQGVFGTEYLENKKELEFTWDLTKESYWELYVYNHGEEEMQVEINKGTRTIYKLEIESKQTATIYGEGNFDEATYTIKAISLGKENLCGKISYQITNSKDNLLRKIPDGLMDMSGLSNANKNEVLTVFKPFEIKPVVRVDKNIPYEGIFVLKPDPATNAVNELFNYGIMKGDPDGGLRPEDTVTRAEAVALLLRTNGNYKDILDEYLFRPAFTDIVNHWAAKEITFACENNLTDGTSQFDFEPERNISVQEFIKMLVTLLGYKEMAEQRGGFPNGYLVTANSLGLTKNLNKELTKDALRKDVALMIANSLDVPLMKQTGFGENIEYSIMDGSNGVKLETLRITLET